MNKAAFITLEGIEGVGKTSAVECVVEWLRTHGREVLVTREPGGTELGDGDELVGIGGKAEFDHASRVVEREARAFERRARPVQPPDLVDGVHTPSWVTQGRAVNRALYTLAVSDALFDHIIALHGERSYGSVLDAGTVVQVASPDELRRRPATPPPATTKTTSGKRCNLCD